MGSSERKEEVDQEGLELDCLAYLKEMMYDGPAPNRSHITLGRLYRKYGEAVVCDWIYNNLSLLRDNSKGDI